LEASAKDFFIILRVFLVSVLFIRNWKIVQATCIL